MHARAMRKAPTDAERALWRLLRREQLAGFRFRRQHRFDDRYIVDFVCLDARLIVEADGSQHLDNSRDAKRDAWLRAQGYRLLRFWNGDILRNPAGVAAVIADALAAAPHPGPPPQGGREQKDANLA